MPHKLLSKKDLKLIVIILIIGFSAIGIRWLADTVSGHSPANIYAQITSRYGTQTVSLSKDMTFSMPRVPGVVFEIASGQIAFAKSDCPDQICVHVGFQGRIGQMAACLPNGLILTIVGDADDDDDLIDIFTH